MEIKKKKKKREGSKKEEVDSKERQLHWKWPTSISDGYDVITPNIKKKDI